MLCEVPERRRTISSRLGPFPMSNRRAEFDVEDGLHQMEKVKPEYISAYPSPNWRLSPYGEPPSRLSAMPMMPGTVSPPSKYSGSASAPPRTEFFRNAVPVPPRCHTPTNPSALSNTACPSELSA